jgi:large subunit ribosomal protein L15
MRLNQIHDNPGARPAPIIVGRGIGSGKGKTCGRGVKGYKARAGSAVKGFEGGQMPLHRRLPKRGFNSPNRKVYAELNLDRLQKAIEEGKVKAGDKLDAAALQAAHLVIAAPDGVRVLGRGKLTAAVTLEVAGASRSAEEAVKAAGGSITLLAPRKSEQPKRAPKGQRNKRKLAKGAPKKKGGEEE